MKLTKHVRGLFAIIMCVAIYGTYGVFSRLISPVFDVFSQEYIRNIFTISFIFLAMYLSGDTWKPIAKKDRIWFAGWGLSGSIVLILLFQAFNQLTLGTVYFLFYSTMILTGFLGGYFLLQDSENPRF